MPTLFAEWRAEERRTFWACFGGFAMDAMDVQIYSFVAPVLISLWGMSNSQPGLVAAAALLSSALGGWGTGLLADRIGRGRALRITVLWFALFTSLCGLAQNFQQLLALRALQGLGFGGEWAAGAVLIGEVVNAQRRGSAVGLVQSAWAVGWALAALLSTVFFVLLPPNLAWRALFFAGLLPALGVFAVRQSLGESEIFSRTKAPQPILAIFSPRFLNRTLCGSLLAIGVHGGYYAIATWLPTFLRINRGLSVAGAGGYFAVIIAGSFCGYLVAAYLNDRLGRRGTFLLFAIGSLIVALSYTRMSIPHGLLLALGFPLGFFASGIFSGVGAQLTELFPTELRGSGQSFCYNAGRGVASAFPLMIGSAATRGGRLGQLIGVYACIAYGLVILAVLILPETRGRELESLAAGPD